MFLHTIIVIKSKFATPLYNPELQRIVNMDQIPNTEYIRFWKFNEYRIIRFLKIDRIPNSNSTIRTQLFEYRILNNKYWKLTDAHRH